MTLDDKGVTAALAVTAPQLPKGRALTVQDLKQFQDAMEVVKRRISDIIIRKTEKDLHDVIQSCTDIQELAAILEFLHDHASLAATTQVGMAQEAQEQRNDLERMLDSLNRQQMRKAHKVLTLVDTLQASEMAVSKLCAFWEKAASHVNKSEVWVLPFSLEMVKSAVAELVDIREMLEKRLDEQKMGKSLRAAK
ncbi:hypothetical protein BD289DRAFT_484678 [Coniella lustricola]|uniref:Uncharacterized protein n=1 Tax=Coniella lustricola TaxID=2025994 RepID=A0A2T3A175_9PEZI|nr:hypothetical protein BD289DRAFT_484678 [Coniella lustricola]